MIDTHCHILPAVDDGPKTIDGALRLAAAAVEEGITTIIATPHHRERHYLNSAKKINRRVKLFNAKLKRVGIPLKVLPGQEYHLTERYPTEFRRGRIQTLAGSRYLLVELPSRKVPGYFTDFLAFMKRADIRVVIAHPERNLGIIDQPDQVAGWIRDFGVLLQVTTQSLAGFFGESVQSTAAYLCKQRLVHLIGTDAHNTVRRKFYAQEGLGIIDKLCGAGFRKSLEDHAVQLISGKEIGTFHQPTV